MPREEGPVVPRGGATAPGVMASGRTPASTTHDTSAVAPVTPPSGAVTGVLDGVRATLAGIMSRRALGWLLLVGWAVWLVAQWVVQPRLVPQEFLAAELAQGRPTSYSVVTVEEDRASGFFSPYRLEVSSVSDDDRTAALDGSYSGPAVSIAYWVDEPVGRLRVVDPNGLRSDVPAALVQDLTAAGVPEAPPGTLRLDPPAQRTYTAGAFLALVSTLVVILGPRPGGAPAGSGSGSSAARWRSASPSSPSPS